MAVCSSCGKLRSSFFDDGICNHCAFGAVSGRTTLFAYRGERAVSEQTSFGHLGPPPKAPERMGAEIDAE